MASPSMLQVLLCDRAEPRRVGRLAEAGAGPHFEYDREFVEEGIELSPLTLKARAGVVTPGPRYLHRLRGLFADSIPDGFGLKVLHQALSRSGRNPFGASALELLAAVGDRGMGALVYRPADEIWGDAAELSSLSALAVEAAQVDADSDAELPDALRRAAGGSGGARPKVTVALHADGRVRDAALPLAEGFRQVLVKFRSARDPDWQVAMESAYLQMATSAGLRAPRSEIVDLDGGEQALVLDRFDREGDRRIHVQSLAAVLEVDFRSDLVDYVHLLDATLRLTRDYSEVTEALRIAAFNVLAQNRDDHAKNVSFLMSPAGEWRLAPAYDLTWGGEAGYHAMSVDGESRAPDAKHIARVGQKLGLDQHKVREVIEQVRSAVARWPEFAAASGVPTKAVRAVGRSLGAQ